MRFMYDAPGGSDDWSNPNDNERAVLSSSTDTALGVEQVLHFKVEFASVASLCLHR